MTKKRKRVSHGASEIPGGDKKRREPERARDQAVDAGPPMGAPSRGTQLVIAAAILLAAVCVLYSEIVFNNRVFLGGDVEAAASFSTPIEKAMEETGGYPMWNPYLFSGMPSYESLSYNPNVYPISFVTSFLTGVLHFPHSSWLLLHVFLLGLGVFLVLWDRGVHYVIAASSGVLMMWLPHYVAVGAYGHGSQSNSIAYIPYALFFWDRIWRGRPMVPNACALAIILGFQLLRAHVQISYYTFALLALHTVYFGIAKLRSATRGRSDPEYPLVLGFFKRALKRENVPAKRLAAIETTDLAFMFALVAAAALLVSAVLFLPVREYAAYSIRGASETGGLEYDYATSWSLHPLESLTFVVPFSFGFGKILYHGHMPFTDYPNYVGLVVFVFAALSIVLARSRFVWFLALVTAATTFVSFGKHFPILYGPLFKFLPYFNKFRVPVMVLIVQHFAFVLLFAIGLSAALKCDRRTLGRIAIWGAAAALVILAASVFSGNYWTGGYARAIAKSITAVRSSADQIQLARMAGGFLSKDLLKASLILLTLFGGLWLFALRKIPAAGLVAVAVGLAAADLYLADRYVLHPEKLYPESAGLAEQVSIIKDKSVRDRFLEPDDVIKYLWSRADAGPDSIAAGRPGKGAAGLFRVLPAFHPSRPLAGGDFATNRYMNFGISSLGGYHPAKLAVYANFISAMDAALQKSNFHLLNVMNARFVVASYPFANIPSLQPVWQGADIDGRKRFIYENTASLPRVFVVDRYRVLEADEALALLPTLPSSGIDLSETVLLEKEPRIRPVSKEGASASITRYTLDEIRVDAKLPAAAILVLSEVYYPKWKVYVDGKEGEILKADYAVRAVSLPAGGHEVVFRYDTATLERGLLISVVTLVIVLTVLLASSPAVYGKLRWKR